MRKESKEKSEPSSLSLSLFLSSLISRPNSPLQNLLPLRNPQWSSQLIGFTAPRHIVADLSLPLMYSTIWIVLFVKNAMLRHVCTTGISPMEASAPRIKVCTTYLHLQMGKGGDGVLDAKNMHVLGGLPRKRGYGVGGWKCCDYCFKRCVCVREWKKERISEICLLCRL